MKIYLDRLADITTQLTTTIYKDTAVARLENLIAELRFAITAQQTAGGGTTTTTQPTTTD